MEHNTSPAWLTVQHTGHIINVQGAIERLRKRACRISSDAWAIMHYVAFSRQKYTSNLLCLSVADLGFENDASLKDIQAKASALLFHPCPSDVPIYTRLTYTEQPKDEWLIFAMEPLYDHRTPLIFCVEEENGEQIISTRSGHPLCTWDPKTKFIFMKQ